MFSNPMYEWWLESLEDRYLLSTPAGAAERPVDHFAPYDVAAHAAPPAAPSAAPSTPDNAFVTDWFLPDNGKAG